MSSSGSENSEQAKMRPNKLFVTGLDGKVIGRINQSDLKQVEEELRKNFSHYGELESVVTKRSFNGAYCFAFIEYKEGEDATIPV